MSTDEDPVAWLRAQVEARKALAVAACGEPGHPVAWVLEGHGGSSALIRDEYGNVVVYDEGSPADEEAAHIAANDPRDTIARCEAELAILDTHARVQEMGPAGEVITRCVCQSWPVVYPCRTVRLLIGGYRFRPGWRDEWGPESR